MSSTTSTLTSPLLPDSPLDESPPSTRRPALGVGQRRAAPVEDPLVLERPISSPTVALPLDPQSLRAPVDAGPAELEGVVHVVVVHHRGEAMLEACLRSLLASEGIRLEIVVVLNHCLEAVPALAQESPQVHLLTLEHSHGFGEANNLGVAWAKERLGPADYYYFVNNDTVSLPDTLRHLVVQLRTSPTAAIAGPQTLIESAPDFINSLGLNVTEDAWGWDEGIGIALCEYGPLPGVRQVMAVTGSALLIESSTFDNIGGWSETYDYYFEDIDLAIKAWKQGRAVLHVPESVIYHRVSATMTVGAERKFFFFWRNRLLLAAIHWPLGMLASVLRRAIVSEVLQRPWKESSLQRRALFGALRKTPSILRERFRRPTGDRGWHRFLHPAGSVPRITLPQPGEVPAALLAAETAASPAEPETFTALDAKAELRAEGLLKNPIVVPPAIEPEPPLAVDTGLLEQLARLQAPAATGRRLMVFGWSPLPFENQRMNFAPGTRSWQFASALAEDGHAVVLVCAPIPGALFAEPPQVELAARGGVTIVRLALPVMERLAERKALIEAFRPAAVVGAAPGPSLWAAQAASDEERVWVDFFGDPMAEGQAREAIYPQEESFGAYCRLVAPLLARGDVFSAVSRRQRLTLIGQLGLAGRLDGDAAGQELVHVIPCAAEPTGAGAEDAPLPRVRFDEQAFLVFWSGGFNTWCDVPTLITGVEAAMDACPEMRFVATGGAIAGHDDRTAETFRDAVAASRHAERFTFLGPVAREEAEAWLRRADLALITEKRLYERELGSSGRVTAWLAAGKTILCSGFSELAQDLAHAGLIYTYEAEDADDLRRRLLEAAASPERRQELAQRAREYALEHLSYPVTTAPLRAWARTFSNAPKPPRASPFLLPEERERQERALQEKTTEIERLQQNFSELAELTERLRQEQQRAAEKERHLVATLDAATDKYHEMRAEIGKIHQSRMWRFWTAYAGLRQKLGRLFGIG